MLSRSTATRRSPSISLLFAACVFAVLGSVACARGAPAADPATEAATLTKLDDDWSTAAATRDANRVAAFYAEDALAFPPNEPLAAGRAAAEKVWAAYFADSTYRISWKTTHAEVNGDLGYTAGTYQDSFTGPDGKTVSGTGKYLCVWKKQADGSWKAIRDMWNTDAK